MRLGKPPIVEASIGFDFASRPNLPPWSFKRGTAFLARFADDYPQVASREQTAFARSSDDSRVLALDGRSLRCSVWRTPRVEYAGFDVLLAESLRRLADYRESFHPEKLLRVSLRYANALAVPSAAPGDLLTFVAPPVPALGPVANWNAGFAVTVPDSDDFLTCEARTVRAEIEGGVGPYWLTLAWNWSAASDLDGEPEALSSRLRAARERLLQCFRDSFTPAAWSLFEPQTE